MPKPYSTGYCRLCDTKPAGETYPFCDNCGGLMIDIDDLDLSPTAPIDVIFKRNSLN
jgi:hypothetical protein